MKSPVADAFRQLYTELQMERDGLFAAVARAYRCQTVLYPGCSIHVNPSSHFPHVLYVDTSDTARRFFTAAADVLRLVEDRKRYARPPHVRFLPLDFTQPLVSNNHQDDAGQAARAKIDPVYQLVAVIHEREAASDPAYVRESSPWPAYTRNADYYVFRRTNVRSR